LTFQADKTRKIIGQHPAHGVKDDTTSSSRNSTYRGSKNWHKDQVFENFCRSGESATGIKIWESSTPVVLNSIVFVVPIGGTGVFGPFGWSFGTGITVLESIVFCYCGTGV
jgi:hypothetical protein